MNPLVFCGSASKSLVDRWSEVMVASLVSVALALVGASRTLDESYYCNMVPPVWEMAGADGLQVRARLEESHSLNLGK